MLLIISGLKDSLIHFAGRLPPEWGVFFLSMLPIFELRGGIPVGVHMFHLPLWKAFIFSYMGNLLPVIPILYILKPLSKLKFVKRYLEKTEKRGELVKKYEALGLTMFVAIPLPVTGAWTGSLLAFIFNIPIFKAFLFIAIGVFTAGVIVSTLTIMGIAGAVIAGIALFTIIILSFLKNRRLFFLIIPILFMFSGCVRGVKPTKKEITIGKIEFKGNNHISSGKLLDVMTIKKGDVYNEDAMRYNMKRIVQYYKDKGFWSARIIQRKGDYNPEKREVNFLIVIFEGNRSIITKIDISGNKVFNKKEVQKILNIKIGEPFDAAKIARSEYLLSLKYADMGYIDAVITVDKKRIGNGVELMFNIKEGKRYYVRKIKIKGLKKVRWKIVRREIVVKEGGIYSPTLAYRSQSKIYSTGLFEYVNFNLKKIRDDSLDVIFTVRELDPRWIGFGIGYESPERLLLDLSWGHNNLMGNMQRIKINSNISLDFLGGTRFSLFLYYEEPYLLGTDVKFLITPSYRYVDEPGFLEKLITINLETRKYLLENTSASFTLNFRNAYIETTSSVVVNDTLIGSKNTNSVAINLYSDGRDNVLNPMKGYYLLLGYEYAGGILGGYNHFDRITIQMALFFPFPGSSVLALHTMWGFTYPEMPYDSVSIDARYEMGGWRTVRGYDDASIGFPDYRGKKSGLQLVQVNAELRFRVFKRIYGYLFVDAGNLWMSPDEIKVSGLFTGAGFGIGFVTPIGPIRLEYARPLTIEGNNKIYLNIGNPF